MEATDYSEPCVYGFMKENKVYDIVSSKNFTSRYGSHKKTAITTFLFTNI